MTVLQRFQKLAASPGHGADHFGKFCGRLVFRQNRQGIAIRPTRQQRIAFTRQKRAAILFLHYRKLRRQICFQRKGAQQGLRETMQGGNPHAARLFQHIGKKLARCLKPFAPRRVARQFLQHLSKRCVIRHHPFAKTLRKPRGHFRCRCLGEGQAQDAPRRHPRQQKSQQPIRQQLGLARTGRGFHPGGNRRIGGARLRCFSALSRVTHSASPSPEDHSSSRAR